MKKSLIATLIFGLLMLCLSGCGAKTEIYAPDTVFFTDDAGRTVEIPAEITRIAPSGNVATMILVTAAPECMVCTGTEFTEEQMGYLPQILAELPVTGQMYGGKSTLNLETLLSCEPQLIIDLGDFKEGVAEDLDALQEQIGIPVVFLKSDIQNMEHMYRTLGDLITGCDERCSKLADFASLTLAMTNEKSAEIREEEKLSVMYTSGASGLETNARGSSQAQVIELIGAKNAIVVDKFTSKSGGNIINPEQLYNFDPDVILFAKGSICDSVVDDNTWNCLNAIKNGHYCEIPNVPYNWMSNPPSINMLLGIWWLGNLLYPQYYDYDINEKASQFFELFWGCEIDDAEIAAFLSNARFR